MLAFLHLLALSVISQLASAVTIPSLLRTRQAPKVTDALQLKGVDWLRATAECHPVQLADLQRAMMDVSDLAFASLPIPEGSDQSFMDFFGVGYSGVSQFTMLFNPSSLTRISTTEQRPQILDDLREPCKGWKLPGIR